MQRSWLSLGCVALASWFAGTAVPQSPRESNASRRTTLAIYQDNFGLVTERRSLSERWEKGKNVLRISDLPASIDPASVRFRSLTDPGTQVVSQDFDFDLATNDRLLEKSIGRQVVVHTRGGRRYEGLLLSYDARQLVLTQHLDRGATFIVNRNDNIGRIHFAGLPQDLQSRPTLTWEVNAFKPGPHEIELSYRADLLRWRADYSLVLNQDDATADLNGWATLENQCGATFHDATVKLIAGEPRAVEGKIPWVAGSQAFRLARQSDPSPAGNNPGRSFGEYRLFELPQKLTLVHQETKQRELLTSPGAPIAKVYVYDGARVAGKRSDLQVVRGYGATEPHRKVQVLVELDNQAEKHLGVTLPRGQWRIYKRDRDGGMEFLGEDLLPHSQPGDKLLIAVGEAFDLTGERKQLAFQTSGRFMEESFEIRVRNQKDEPVTVQVLEKMYRTGEWTILDKSHDYQQLDQRTIVFPVTVEAGKEAVVTYQVRYQF